jgi:uncharacterized FlaG/YvyC family protein
MTTIDKLGAAIVRQVTKHAKQDFNIPMVKSRKPAIEQKKPVEPVKRVMKSEEAKQLREPSDKGRRVHETLEDKRMTLQELAEHLRKINLTFDLFEVQARFTTNRETGEISVEVINQRTGEVIRKIPPYDLPEFHNALLRGDPLAKDIKV